MCAHADSRHQVLFEELEQLAVADPVEAVGRSRKAIELIDQDSGIADQLRFRRILAMAHAHTGQFETALAVCEEAANLPNSSTDPVELARVQLASMQPLAHLGNIDDALRAGREAYTLLDEVGNTSLAGRAALNIGAILAMTGRQEQALESFDQALKYLTDEHILAGQIETNRGTALAALDRFGEAESAFERAIELMGTELPWAAAIVEGNLADLASRQGAINRSLKHFEAARRHLEQDEALGDLGRIEAEQAAVLTMSGLKGLARDTYARAIPLLTDHGTAGDYTH